LADNQHKGSDNFDDYDKDFFKIVWLILRIILFIVSLPVILATFIVVSTFPRRERPFIKFIIELGNILDTFNIFSGK
jgi:hypothetical protein